MKVALVHEFLTQYGGAERVLEELHKIFPNAPVYTLVYDKGRSRGRFEGWNIKTSFLQHLPFANKHYKWFLALMPWATESFKFDGFDLVISDSSAFAKGILVPKNIPHICYCHTPTRYLWQMEDEYISTQKIPWWTKILARPVLSMQRKWDFKAAQRVTRFIANSHEVAGRIKKYYSRDSEVIYPPVRTDFFTPLVDQKRGDCFLAAGRLEPYKRLDLVLQACSKLNLPLKVAGTGTVSQDLKSLAGPQTEFLGWISDEQLRDLYRHARAFIFPALEDAGMMVVEAMACGTPVIAFGQGGAVEFVEHGKHGILFTSQSVDSLSQALKGFERMKFDPNILRARAEEFGVEVFRNTLLRIIEDM